MHIIPHSKLGLLIVIFEYMDQVGECKYLLFVNKYLFRINAPVINVVQHSNTN